MTDNAGNKAAFLCKVAGVRLITQTEKAGSK